MYKKLPEKLFSTTAAGIYMLLFAVAIGVATFIENDFGTSSAQKLVYSARWFELLLLLFGITILVNIFRFRLLEQKKYASFTFHAAILIILFGALITRLFGFEGMMHIREHSASNSILSRDDYLVIDALYNGQNYHVDAPILMGTKGSHRWKKTVRFGDKKAVVKVTDFTPNPKQTIMPDENGRPIMRFVVTTDQGRQDLFISSGEALRINGRTVSMDYDNPDITSDITITTAGDSAYFTSPDTWQVMEMATQINDTVPAHVNSPLFTRRLYQSGDFRFVIGDFFPKGRLTMVSEGPKMEGNSLAGLELEVTLDGDTQKKLVIGQSGQEGMPASFDFGDAQLAVAYGAKRIQLPFQLKLNNFILERYPGTNSPSSFESQVTLIDTEKGIEEDRRIFMNNILDHRGYRFFQTSYDRDEMGTYLSVNHDWWGTIISYIGYALLTLGMLLTLVQPRSRYRSLSEQLKKSKNYVATFLLLMMAATVSAQDLPEIPAHHAEKWSRVVVQDFKGRLKPMNTHDNEILRKLHKGTSFRGQNADQVVLNMIIYPDYWVDVPFLKNTKEPEVQEILGTDSTYLSYSDFFDGSSYKLEDYVEASNLLETRDRTSFDKAILKMDEKLNICNMIFLGNIARIFPQEYDDNDRWLTPADLAHGTQTFRIDSMMTLFFPAYRQTVQESMQSGDWELADKLIDQLEVYQRRYANHIMPSKEKIDAEIQLNKRNVFGALAKVYGLLGLLFLIAFFILVFSHSQLQWPTTVAWGLLATAFIYHLYGLAMRWYVSGHAPWSNGYESMIYIASTTVLAGLIFARKSLGGLASTAILSSVILLIAGLSNMDPEISPLVPVLKSYWMTIHVSMEAGSYGFLILAAIIGVINLILYLLTTERNKNHLFRTIKEMSYISEMTMIGGLIMFSIGTYLGGVWANESWGRYWGWDAKETWALVSILVYAFILHMRFIPGMRGFFALNVGSLFGFASIMMTYFGVNYYLSGLHSYAAGDPVPLPSYVPITAAVLAVLSILAFLKKRKLQLT